MRSVANSRRARRERGQSVLLMPAGFLILILLAALVLEAAALHLRQRQLIDLADSIANDAVAYGFDVDEFRTTGDVVVDENRARSIVADEISISLLPDAVGTLNIVDTNPPTVEVVLQMEHTYIIGAKFFGGLSDTLSATGRAELELSG